MDIQFNAVEICPVCGAGNLKAIMRGKDADSLRLDYSILQCPQCRACITSPQPHPEDLWKLYDERSSADFVPSAGSISRLRQYFFKRYINRVLRNVSGNRLNVLDYGCGDGLLSLLLSQHPRCGHITASDFHSAAPHYIAQAGGNVCYIPRHDFVKGSDSYDLILCRQVLEHVPDPVACLSLFRMRMNHNAWILVEVPNFETVWRRIFGANWSMLYLPRHLLHYTPESLRAVLKKAGFAVQKLKRGHFPGMKSSLYYSLGRHAPAPGPLAVLLFPLQVLLDFICRRSSVIAAYAQVPANPDVSRNNESSDN
jgi:2-polyprenyl-3-methyl-5-hydroxy-6-metoxy-1,4-benzoquinol methylase